MNTPKVSVVIPIYNVEKYIERCARSLFEQTLDDIEYIFIDDCTPDKSVSILESVLKEYPHRIPQTQIIRLPQNIGLPSVRKKGISIAKGEYIAHCDSDDWVERNMYELMYDEALKNNYDIVRCLFTMCNEKFNKKCYIVPSEIYTQKEKLQAYQIEDYGCNAIWDKLIHRKIFTDYDIIYPTFNMYEDRVIVTQAIYYCEKIGYIDRVLYYYYQNPNSICHESGEDKILNRIYQKKANIDLIIQFLEDKNIASQYSKEIITLKYNAKVELLPIIHKPHIRKIWNSIYPEVNTIKIGGIKRKICYFLGCLNLYTFATKIIRIYHKIFDNFIK